MKDLLVQTPDPKGLDLIVQQFGAVVSQEPDGTYRIEEKGYRVRCYGNPGFIKFMIEQQGYGKVIAEEEVDAMPPTKEHRR